jgi:DNA-binding NarL/FixJ family response regulator
MSASIIKIIVVDDHDIFQAGVKTVLEGEPDMAIVGSIVTIETLEGLWKALAQLCAHHGLSERDVILLDLMMKLKDGSIELTIPLLERISTLPPCLLIITGYQEPHAHLHMAAQARLIDGIILKDEAFSDSLGGRIRQVSGGIPYYSERSRELLALDKPPDVIYLKRRDVELLDLRESMQPQQIAFRWGKTQNCVYTALHRLRNKFGVEDDVALIIKAKEARSLGRIIVIDSEDDDL